MKQTIRIITLLLLAIAGAGQVWGGKVYIGTLTGGSLKFYSAYENSTFSGEITSTTSVSGGATVFFQATPDANHSLYEIGVTNFTVERVSDTGNAEARRRASGPGIGDEITLAAVDASKGIFKFTMPAIGDAIVSGTFPDQIPVTITAGSTSKVYDGTPLRDGSFDVSGLPEGHEHAFNVTMTAESTLTNVGSTSNVIATVDGVTVSSTQATPVGNYLVTIASGTLEVTAKSLTVTADSDTKVYDTTPLTKDSYTSTALAEGDAFESVTITGSQTVVGESGNVASAAVIRNGNGDDVTDCYAITYVSGTLTVTTATMTGISATDYEAEYDGAAHTITMTGVPEGATVTFGDRPSAVTSAKAPVYTSVVERTIYWKVVKDNYYDVTGSATVKISRKPLTITADSETKVYDGTALKKNIYTSTALADGDRIVRVTVTGSQTNVGECENVPSAAFIRNASSWDMTSNYDITYVSGTLEVTTATMTGISATGYEGIYDGASHSLTVTGVPQGATVTYGESEDDISGTEVPTYTDVVDKTIYWKVAKANYYDVTGHATMKITAKDVTITAQDKVFAYTGSVQSWPEYDVDGLVGSDAITAVVTGSITYPSEGTVANVVESYEFTSGTPGNYSVTTHDGLLTMTNASAAITITAASESWTYDGETHANNTVTVTEGELLEGDVLVAEATGSVTNVADTKNRNNPIAAGYKVMNGTEDVTDNYAITAVAGKLEVMPKAVTISGITASDKTYDGTTTAKLNTDNYVIEGKLEADNLVIRISNATADFVDKNVGTNKEIIITGIVLGGSARGNYTLSEQPQGLTATISKKILSVTANDMTISYGDEPDNDSVRYTGFASGESESDLDGNLTYTYNTASNGKGSAYTAGSPVGTYYIIARGLSSGNYRFIYRTGVLTVEEKVIDYADGTITQDENGYTVNLDEGEGSANELPDDDDLANLTYSRTLTPPGNGSGEVQIDGEAANLYTVCLPFTPLTDGHVKYYTLSRVSGETIFFNEVTTAPVSHTPYLVAVMGSANFKERCADVEVGSMEINSTTVDGYTFTGTFTGLTNAESTGKYILQNGNRWGLVTTEKPDARIPPFRAYIESTSGARLLIGSIDGETTGIRYIRTTDADGTEQWYDLNGHRISKPTKKGVYIHNGRKEAVK